MINKDKSYFDSLLKDKILLITGGTGSFGNAMIEGFLYSPLKEIRVFSRDEKKQEETRLKPIYPSSERLTKRGLNQKFFQNTLAHIVAQVPALVEENLPEYLLKSLKLMPKKEAILNIHFPKDFQYFSQANHRLKFEEAFFFQLGYGLKKHHQKTAVAGNPFPIVGDYFNHFYQHQLPFELTNAQKRVLKEIRNDMKMPIQMNRLLQGDVGSGKTMVALLSMLIALDNGFQSCIMAPTEILAQQHFNSISDLLKNTDVKIKILTGSTKTAERKIIHQELESGNLSILVGTHAVLEDKVKFSNLGLVIIDEQHRFGVEQRAKLWRKNKIPPGIAKTRYGIGS
jgi:ATP-dependent DNA helicase RecG